MKKNIIFTIIFLLLGVSNVNSQIGQWKSYLSYYEPTEIEEAGGNMLYVLASNGLYSYNKKDHSLQTYDKTTVLNDCGIAHIAWCQAAKRLVIVYENNNIDLLEQNNNVVNIADYMNKSMTSDKTVYSIDVSGKYTYLATGFGIVKLNVADAEISDAYQLGFKVDYSYIEGDYLYAASPTDGLYQGSLTSNLLDKANWKRVGNYTARPKTMDPNNLALVKTLSPGGPKYNNFGFIRIYQETLYTVGGGYLSVNDLHRPGCVQVLNNNDWQIYEDDLKQKTGHEFVDLNSVDTDPTNPQRVFASGRTGLYEFNNGLFVKEYTPENSPLRGAATVDANNKDYNIVQGIKFDSNANLWVLNSMSATTSILKYDKDNKWTNHHKSELMRDGYSLSRMQTPIIDSRGLLWFANKFFNYTQAVCYQPSTDAIKTFTNFVNDDGTTLNITYVNCVAEDKNNNIWIGTNVGPMYLSPEQISADNPVFTQVKVPRNDGTNYADYLLSGVDINCIVVDQANRKWFGTNGNGVYLISSDNIHQIEHFTEDNSKLLSNNIESIAINEESGEVFFGTDKGLCSYMSNATSAAQGMTKDNVYAYPNPVKPDYTGPITITGLDENAEVKIVTVNGTLVNEGRASGGKFKWYGIDQSGKSVVSGVYIVEVATQEGEKGVVCKIAIVR
jgi:hypothetical protein